MPRWKKFLRILLLVICTLIILRALLGLAVCAMKLFGYMKHRTWEFIIRKAVFSASMLALGCWGWKKSKNMK